MKITVVAGVFAAGFAGGLFAGAHQKPAAPTLPVERVTGIGGVFFKADNPTALRQWYQEKLGIAIHAQGTFSLFEWREPEDASRVGTTVWSVFPADTTYFAPSTAPFMLNYRVRDLDKMLAQLRAAGVRVDPKIADEFNGRFAWIIDPEGNKIELWEPEAGF